MNSDLKITGELEVTLLDEFGNIKHQDTYKNLVVTVGKNFIASRMKDATATAMTHMGIGSGTTAADVGQTALVTQISNRIALASTTVTNHQVAYAATFGAGVSTGAITEAGIFNASTAGTMLSRTVFSVVNKGASDTLNINWTISVN